MIDTKTCRPGTHCPRGRRDWPGRAGGAACRLLWLATALLLASCGDADAPATAAAPTTAPAEARVVSLSPTATDLLLAMGGGEALVGVSNFDNDAAVAELPRVGDYQTIDWERMLALEPTVIFVHAAPDRLPAGLEARAVKMGALVQAVRVERLDDLTEASWRVGLGAGLGEAGRDLAGQIREEVGQVRRATAGLEPVPTLIVLSPDGRFVAGHATWLDDLLQAAGGRNVLAESQTGYPTLDPEAIVALDPRRVLVLLPGATPQTLEQARQFWARKMPGWQDRVTIITDEKAMIAGSAAPRLARRFAEALHPPQDAP